MSSVVLYRLLISFFYTLQLGFLFDFRVLTTPNVKETHLVFLVNNYIIHKYVHYSQLFYKTNQQQLIATHMCGKMHRKIINFFYENFCELRFIRVVLFFFALHVIATESETIFAYFVCLLET
jgi:hypothetical protein